MRRLVERALIALGLHRKPEPKPWLVDREGVVYKPVRRVVLKAKSA